MPKSVKIESGVVLIRIPLDDVEVLQSALDVDACGAGNKSAQYTNVSARKRQDDWRVDAMWGVVGPVVQIVKSWKLLAGVVVLLLSVNFEKLARFSDALKELIQ